MSLDNERYVSFDTGSLPVGRVDRTRMGQPNSRDLETRPVATAADWEATVQLAKEDGWYKKARARA